MPLGYPDGYWTDPITGQSIPKTPRAHQNWRADLYKRAGADPQLQQALKSLSASSILFWINTFVYTERVECVLPDGVRVPVGGGVWWAPDPNQPGRYRHTHSPRVAEQWTHGQVVRGQEPRTPFVTWPYQDDPILALQDSIRRGQQALIDKFRDAGATWLCVAVFHHEWLFEANSLFLEVSRVQNLVDEQGNNKSIFYKHDYINANLPAWMLPCNRRELMVGGKWRKHMLLRNPSNGSQIAGESTTKNVGQGDRRKAIFFDEFARVPDGTAMVKAAREVASCLIYNSTPEGPGTEFTEMKKRAEQGEQDIRIINLDYYNHPEKGVGRKWTIDTDGSVTGTAGRGYYDTPWLRRQVKRAGGNTREIAENIFHDHMQAGQAFFNHNIIEQHRRMYATPRLRRYRLVEASAGTPAFLEGDPDGQWSVFIDLDNGRFPQNTNYVIGIDVARGNGWSNSVLAVMDRETGKVVAEFVTPNMKPAALGVLACYVGRQLFGGQAGEAFLIWEVNGPGQSFTPEVVEAGYTRLYYRSEIGKAGDRKRRDYGFLSTRPAKQFLLGNLDSALTRNEIVVPSWPGLNEMLDYVYMDDGSIGAGAMRDETSGAREAHGDRVIAYALNVHGRVEAEKFEGRGRKYAPGTLGQIAEHEAAELEAASDRASDKDPFRRGRKSSLRAQRRQRKRKR